MIELHCEVCGVTMIAESEEAAIQYGWEHTIKPENVWVCPECNSFLDDFFRPQLSKRS